jgi:osmoprotectant transport system substrate-binding protein
VSALGRLAAAAALVCTLVVAAACGAPIESEGASEQPQGAALRIKLGTQAFPEARIMGELWRQALAVNGYTVDLQKGVGPAAELDRLLQERRIDGHVAYTGTVLSIVAGQPVSGLDPQETYEKARAFYATRNMAMSAMTPFENKDAIAVTRTFAQANQLTSIADLAKLPGFRLAARPEFDGLHLGTRGLAEVYGLTRMTFVPVPVGQQYAALDDGSADAVNAFTTDPQLRSDAYTVLADPKLLFGSQNVVMTVDAGKLKVVGEQKFLAVVAAVNGRLTQEEIVALNAEVADGRPDADVARQFLRDHGLLTPFRPGTG